MTFPYKLTGDTGGQKRVLIVSSNVLFSEIITQSLATHSGLILIPAIHSITADEIKAHSPDVIIVDEAIGSEELGLLRQEIYDGLSPHLVSLHPRFEEEHVSLEKI